MKRKICVITGTRAEYGILYCTLMKLKKDPKVELQIVVSGRIISGIGGAGMGSLVSIIITGMETHFRSSIHAADT